MKFFYAFVLGISILSLLFINVVSIATSPEEATAAELVRYPQNWELVYKTGGLPYETAEESKERLIRFMQDAPVKSYEGAKSMALILMTSVVFAAIGLAREAFREGALKASTHEIASA